MDIFKLLEEDRTVAPPTQDCLDRVRSQLFAAALEPAERGQRPLRRRRWTISIAAGAVALTSAAATYAVLRPADPRTSFSFQCGTSIIASESGDPIADCQQELTRQRGVAPPLIGWITPAGVVAVLPRTEAPPAGANPLPLGFRQDRSLLYLHDTLNDVVGPLSQCVSAHEATAYARRQLGIAGLIDWTVSVRKGNSGTANCTEFYETEDAATRTVKLIPETAYGRTASSNAVYEANLPVKLDRLLHSQMTTSAGPRCLNLGDAASLAERDARQLGIPTSDVNIAQAGRIAASGPTCATPAIDPAGLIEIALWAVPPSTPTSP